MVDINPNIYNSVLLTTKIVSAHIKFNKDVLFSEKHERILSKS